MVSCGAGGQPWWIQADIHRAEVALCSLGCHQVPPHYWGRPQVLAIIARHQAAVMCALPMQSCFVPLCMHPAEQPWVKSRNMKKEELTLLKSREVIAINQDPLGIAGDRVWKQGPYEVILPASVPYAYRDSLLEIAQSSDQGMRLPV